MSDKLEGLRQAMGADQADFMSVHRRYHELVHQIAAYEYGVGPWPTVDDFLKWRCNAEVRRSGGCSGSGGPGGVNWPRRGS